MEIDELASKVDAATASGRRKKKLEGGHTSRKKIVPPLNVINFAK
jgi:hypothetical protein